MIISTSKGKGESAVVLVADIKVTFGDNLDEAIDLVGEEVVYECYVAEGLIKARSVIKALHYAGKTDKEIQAEMDTWKPGVSRRVSADPAAKMLAKAKTMTEAELRALIAQITAIAEG